jgi:hypothetical protein
VADVLAGEAPDGTRGAGRGRWPRRGARRVHHRAGQGLVERRVGEPKRAMPRRSPSACRARCRARGRSPRRCGGRRRADRPCSAGQIEAGVAWRARVSMWSRKPMPVGRRPCPCRRASGRTRCPSLSCGGGSRRGGLRQVHGSAPTRRVSEHARGARGEQVGQSVWSKVGSPGASTPRGSTPAARAARRRRACRRASTRVHAEAKHQGQTHGRRVGLERGLLHAHRRRNKPRRSKSSRNRSRSRARAAGDDAERPAGGPGGECSRGTRSVSSSTARACPRCPGTAPRSAGDGLEGDSTPRAASSRWVSTQSLLAFPAALAAAICARGSA